MGWNINDVLPHNVLETCNDMGWSTYLDVDANNIPSVELSQYSPAGEDFSFEVSCKNFIEQVAEYARDFDVDEHAMLWIPDRGTRGVPDSIRAILDDAEAIQSMLNELTDALEKLR